MSAKRVISATSDGPRKRRRKTITLEAKMAIVERFERGERIADIGRAVDLHEATVRTICSNAGRIKSSFKCATSVSAAKVNRTRSETMEKMEKSLSLWIERQNQSSIPVSTLVIKEKALNIYKNISKDKECVQPFIASSGWFDRFRKRYNFHNLKITGEAAAADKVAAEDFVAVLAKIIEDGGYSPKQVINIDETGLFWKRMPSRTFISRDEKVASGFKAAKDRCTLVLGGNADGDLKLKPLLVYRSENPRALRKYSKELLPVIWRSNTKAWVTSGLFLEYFENHLHKETKAYCAKNNLEFKILLVLDNAPGHPPHIVDLSEHIKVVFLPPNTTSIIQPMDQGVIATFKAHYIRRTFSKLIEETDGGDRQSVKDFWRKFNIKHAIDIIAEAWAAVPLTCMNGVWKDLWPDCVHFKGFDVVENVSLLKSDILSFSRKVGFEEVNEEEVEELLNAQHELNDEELIHDREEETNGGSCSEEMSEEPEAAVRTLKNKEIARAFCLIKEALQIFEDGDPDEIRSSKVNREVNAAIGCYRQIYKENSCKAKQISLDAFFKKAGPDPAGRSKFNASENIAEDAPSSSNASRH